MCRIAALGANNEQPESINFSCLKKLTVALVMIGVLAALFGSLGLAGVGCFTDMPNELKLGLTIGGGGLELLILFAVRCCSSNPEEPEARVERSAPARREAVETIPAIFSKTKPEVHRIRSDVYYQMGRHFDREPDTFGRNFKDYRSLLRMIHRWCDDRPQMIDDEHEILETLERLYDNAVFMAGPPRGGVGEYKPATLVKYYTELLFDKGHPPAVGGLHDAHFKRVLEANVTSLKEFTVENVHRSIMSLSLLDKCLTLEEKKAFARDNEHVIQILTSRPNVRYVFGEGRDPIFTNDPPRLYQEPKKSVFAAMNTNPRLRIGGIAEIEIDYTPTMTAGELKTALAKQIKDGDKSILPSQIDLYNVFDDNATLATLGIGANTYISMTYRPNGPLPIFSM